MGQLHAEHVTRVIDWIRHERKGHDVSLEDMMRLAEVMAEGFRSAVETVDTTISGELDDMAREIAAMKHDLVDLRLADMRHDRIPQAGRELDAIVEATEEATNTIMTAAEEIMAADPSDPDAYQAVVNDKIVEIFEACSFQDITGQRISKVVTTLNHLDARISTLIERLKLMRIDNSAAPAGAADESEEERRRRELILHGPQFKGEGVSQDDVDALLR
jgi:chemotaxis protein CheZ